LALYSIPDLEFILFWHILHHWLYEDLYIPLWPNILASFVVYIIVVFKVNSIKTLQKLEAERAEQRHEEMKQHVTNETINDTSPVTVINVSDKTIDTEVSGG
jgi:hypothetical protein